MDQHARGGDERGHVGVDAAENPHAHAHDESQTGDDPTPGIEEKKGWSIKDVAMAGLFAALTAVGAWIAVPLPIGVPFTLQLLVSLLSGVVLGSRIGALSQGIYLVMGAVGFPVFAGRTGGLQEFVGRTGGYLIGFVLAAWIVGKLTERHAKLTPVRGGVAMLAGLVAIYVPGALWLAVHLGSLKTALIYGVITYLPVDLIKAVCAYIIAQGLEARGIQRAPGVVKGPKGGVQA